MPEVAVKTIVDRDYLCGPVEIAGNPYGYTDPYGWVRADLPGTVMAPDELIPRLNRDNWNKVGRFEVGSEHDLVAHGGERYALVDGDWMRAEPGLPVRPASSSVARQLYDENREAIREFFFAAGPFKVWSSEYGFRAGSSKGGFYDWNSFEPVKNGVIINMLNAVFQGVESNVPNRRHEVKKESCNPFDTDIETVLAFPPDAY